MSQSMAFLPPRLSSPTGSIISSMYQSAISTPSTHFTRGHQDANDEIEHAYPTISQCQEMPQSSFPNCSKYEERGLDDVIISFVSHPILIKLGTDPPVEGASQKHCLPGESQGNESLYISLETGIIACALQGWHIRGMSEFASFWTANQSSSESSTSTSVADSQPDTMFTFESLGLVLLVLTTSACRVHFAWEYLSGGVFQTTFVGFNIAAWLFPIIPRDYNWLGKSQQLSDSAVVSVCTRETGETRHTGRAITTKKSSFDLSIGDISLFTVNDTRTPKDDSSFYASPILITDCSLPFQHDRHHPDPNQREEHPHLPTFEFVGWTGEKAPSGWFSACSMA